MSNYHDQKEKENILHQRQLLDSLPEFCKSYFRSIEPRTTSRTRLAYAYDLQVFFRYLKDNNPEFKNREITLNDLDNIKFLDIEEYMEYLKYYQVDIEENKSGTVSIREKEVLNSNEGIKRKIASLRSFYNYYYKNELIKNNPASLVSMPKLRQKEIIRLEPDEVAKLLDLVESGDKLTDKEKKYHNITKDRDLALLSLLLGTGMRVSECVGINLSDIDYNTNAIKIKRKGGKEVFIYFSDEVEKYLKKYIDVRKQNYEVYEKDADALFLSLQNKRMTTRSVENLVKKYAKIVTPLKRITPHKLRSTYGTELYKETGDIYLVADVLGHSDVNTTKKHYAAIEDDRRRSARNIVKLRTDE